MVKLLVRGVFAGLGLWLASKFVHGVEILDLRSLVLATLLLAVANAVVRPIAVVLTLPLTIITLGLFLLVLNGAMILLVSALLQGFNVHGLIPAIMAAIVTGVTSWIGHIIVGDGKAERRG